VRRSFLFLQLRSQQLTDVGGSGKVPISLLPVLVKA